MFTATAAHAQAPPGADAFVKEFIATINRGSVDERRALLHPIARPCTETAARGLFERAVKRQASSQVPAQHTWAMRPVPPDQPLMFADKLDYPVRPSHVLQIDYETEARRGRTMLLQVVQDAGRWYEVFPCPKPGQVPR